MWQIHEAQKITNSSTELESVRRETIKVGKMTLLCFVSAIYFTARWQKDINLNVCHVNSRFLR